MNGSLPDHAQPDREFILRLARAAEFRDPERGAHIQRLALYAHLIAGNLGLPAAEQDAILHAAPLHDLGKLTTPDAILFKPGRLTAEEFEVMKKHAQAGFEILRHAGSAVLRLAAEIALSHHEKFDGTGYPHGLAGEAIPLCGRIVAVADAFDALTSERPYKRAWDMPHAVEVLRHDRGSHFDARCVDAFLRDLDAVRAIRERFPGE